MLSSYLKEIEQALQDYLDEFEHPVNLYEPVRYLFRGGGKRLRPILVLLSCEVVGGNPTSAMHAAVATEFIHAFTLVHDDIMDSSALRRGKPTVHTVWDTNTAILTGDVLIGLALRMLERSAVRSANGLAVMSAVNTGLIDVCEGQALDVANTQHSDMSIEQYFATIEKKTAKLLEMCVEVGALIGNASSEQITTIKLFARSLGLAFQMQDDLLDLLGSEVFGKTQGGDIVEGKRTWFVLRLREKHASPLLDEFFANNGLGREHVAKIVADMHGFGVIDEGRATIQKFTNDAFQFLNQLPENSGRDKLQVLATQLLDRKR